MLLFSVWEIFHLSPQTHTHTSIVISVRERSHGCILILILKFISETHTGTESLQYFNIYSIRIVRIMDQSKIKKSFLNYLKEFLVFILRLI